jgi:chromosome segregation ATPase
MLYSNKLQRRIKFMEKSIITETIQQQESIVVSIEKRIQKNEKNIEATRQALPQSENKVAQLKGQHDVAREQRQRALADGKDVKDITRRIREIRDRLEENEDEQIGLQDKLDRLQHIEAPQLATDLREARLNVLKYKLYTLVPEYNKTAKALAGTVKEIFDLKIEFHDPNNQLIVSNMGWIDNALDKIPQLYIPEDGEKVERYSFWHRHVYVQDKIKASEGA